MASMSSAGATAAINHAVLPVAVLIAHCGPGLLYLSEVVASLQISFRRFLKSARNIANWSNRQCDELPLGMSVEACSTN
jgi:hypothetical protein